MALCEENCELINYNYNNEKVKCSCEIKTSVSPNFDAKFNKNEFYKSFIDIKNIANINILKCYKIVLNIKELSYNYGFYIITVVIALYFITIIIFRFISYKKLKIDLYNISVISNNVKLIEAEKSININKKNSIKKKIKKKNKKAGKLKQRKTRNINNANNFNISDKNIQKNNKKIIECLRNNSQITQNEQNNSMNRLNMIKILKFKLDNLNTIYIKELLEQKDFEINSSEYDEALKLDKRNYFQYYIS